MRPLLLILILFIYACNGNGDGQALNADNVSSDVSEAYQIPSTTQLPSAAKTSRSQGVTKQVVKTGGIEFQSENIEEDYNKIRDLLPTYQAYIESENQSRLYQQLNYRLVIRVPSSLYDSLFEALSLLSPRLDNRYSNIQDVTERYYDLKTRIKNKQALEERYLELLSKATAMNDIIELEKNLNEVRTEIERLQGQLNLLSKKVNFSTINVRFYEELPYVYDSTYRKGFAARVLNGLNQGWQGFLSFLVGITTLWPFIILIGGGIYIYKRLRKK